MVSRVVRTGRPATIAPNILFTDAARMGLSCVGLLHQAGHVERPHGGIWTGSLTCPSRELGDAMMPSSVLCPFMVVLPVSRWRSLFKFITPSFTPEDSFTLDFEARMVGSACHLCLASRLASSKRPTTRTTAPHVSSISQLTLG